VIEAGEEENQLHVNLSPENQGTLSEYRTKLTHKLRKLKSFFPADEFPHGFVFPDTLAVADALQQPQMPAEEREVGAQSDVILARSMTHSLTDSLTD